MTRGRRLLFAGLMLPVVAGLVALGVWQLQRRVWKLALIARVERRLASAPVAAPGPDRWPALNADDDAYRRIVARGTFRSGGDSYVQAVTDLGAGYWVLTPFDTDRGFTVLVDRGFVPQQMRGHAPPAPGGIEQVTGLLRLTEPHGGFLRGNDAAADRWYSRDVVAIAARRRLGATAPYFVDADAAPSPGWPRGGLTVVRFPNNHLSYALTWFALAALLAGACARMVFASDRR